MEVSNISQCALAICEKALEPDHPGIAVTMENYATLLHSLNRPQEARTLYQRAEAIHARKSSYSTS